MQRAAHINNYYRTGTAGAIALLHIVALYMLLNPTVIRPIGQATAPSIRWLALPPLEEPEPVNVVPRTEIPARPKPIPFTPDTAITQPPADDLDALRSYVWCGALDDGKDLMLKKPCDKLQLDLHKSDAPNRAATDQERALAKKFERDKAVADAPILLPCFGGGSVSITCLAKAAVTGEFEMGSYASNDPSQRCDPRFAGAEQCRRNYSLQSFSPTNR